MWNLVLVSLEKVLVSVQDRFKVCAVHTTGSKIIFGRTQWNCLVTWARWNLVSVYLQIVLIWTQDWCKVCVERTIGSKIILDAPDGTPR
jgi:hypothetical protein